MATGTTAAADTGGYVKEIFKDGRGNDKKFQCNSCNLVLREPVQAFCGHRYCRSCLEALISTGEQISCKQCEIEDPEHENDTSIITQDQIFPDNAIKREMAKLKVSCPNIGCSWNGIFKNFEDHFANCEFKRVKCLQCNNLVKMSELEHHENSECTSQCTMCGDMVVTKFMKEHLELGCPKVSVNCGLCGKQGIIRENLQGHQSSSDCRGEPIACPAGCGMIDRKAYHDHFGRMNHEVWLVQEIESLERRVEQLLTRPDPVSELRDHTVATVAQIDEKIRVLERQIGELASRPVSSVTSGIQGTENIDTKIRQAVELQLQSVNERLDVKAGTFEGISSALHRELEKTITAVEKLERHRQEMASLIDQNQNKIRGLERTIALKDMTIAELELKSQSLEAASYDGTFLWRVADFTKKHQDAVHGRTISIYSSPFYTSRRGYKMCARLYPNGDGMGKGSHLSLFFVIMRGNYDPLLKWPFGQRVTFCMINQNGGEHVIDSFRPDPQSSSFKRPTSDMNIASGCPLFIRLEMLQNPNNGFLKDDTMFLKITVDVNDVADPISTFEERVKSQS